jgi:tRNA threonylcarbamoyladenosine biosynthesis protein TsaB
VSLLIHIDTAVQSASVCLSSGKQVLGSTSNPSQRDHAAWLHLAIAGLLKENNLKLKDLNAIAVSAGPGSYTGLRVGMAAAKGLCYAANIPLITVSTLKMMAVAMLPEAEDLICPMIDARRMEVFTAIFDRSLELIAPPMNLILQSDSFDKWLNQRPILFSGNGSVKYEPLLTANNSRFILTEATAENMISLALQSYENQDFADLAYTEPFYGKEFFSPIVKSSL